MEQQEYMLNQEEQVVFKLRSLYRQYGYQQYKMSNFEEYDLYAENKNFLVSQNVITFTGANGKLMALKPDVTLSIIKNSPDEPEDLEKVCYNENVYRVDGGSHEFKELVQTGLECIGHIDLYAMGEVLMLAARSLQSIHPNYILDVSHLAFVQGILDEAGLNESQRSEILRCMNSKNTPELSALCAAWQIREDLALSLQELTGLYAPMGEALLRLKELTVNEKTQAALDELSGVYQLLCADACQEHVYLDFSLTNDMQYYNGLVFRGFVDGLPRSVLSGGRYDKLVHRLGKQGGAIGFAVYLDLLERLNRNQQPYDVDVLLLYGDDADLTALAQTVRMLTMNGQSVKAQRKENGSLRYRQLLLMKERGVEILETHD
ncbi:MAG: ATP phosphoribosyltransferase regulatory subunit [Firmicutes bacterium]|nr:ATP phosphoribosyltransferase regulatory subunit [Bacillota bacterium]